MTKELHCLFVQSLISVSKHRNSNAANASELTCVLMVKIAKEKPCSMKLVGDEVNCGRQCMLIGDENNQQACHLFLRKKLVKLFKAQIGCTRVPDNSSIFAAHNLCQYLYIILFMKN